MRPLLSICVPTFNRSEMLNVCLATILPQAADFNDMVEVWVCDNASTDATRTVVDKYAAQYSFHYQCNPSNIGLLGNISLVAGSLATGEYVWLLGDDDLLAVGAVSKVMDMLQQVKALDLDLIALNVGYFLHGVRPGANEVLGGVTSLPDVVLRRSNAEGIVPFEQLLEGPCADFTAMYASIIRQRLWASEYPSAIDSPPFTSIRTTYPHALLIARHLPGKQAGVLREPLVCNFEMPPTQFSWAKFHALTVVLHATKLLKLFESHGVPRAVLEPYYLYQLNNRGADLGELCWNRRSAGGWAEAAQFAWLLRRHPLKVLKLFVIGCANAAAPALVRVPTQWLLARRLKRHESTQHQAAAKS